MKKVICCPHCGGSIEVKTDGIPSFHTNIVRKGDHLKDSGIEWTKEEQKRLDSVRKECRTIKFPKGKAKGNITREQARAAAKKVMGKPLTKQDQKALDNILKKHSGAMKKLANTKESFINWNDPSLKKHLKMKGKTVSLD
tara:strand:- start:188 stop:607 length:420 start_codon:yes stop_codon:yes gene_type:complete